MSYVLPNFEKVNYKLLPFEKEYISFVLKKYLFEGVSQTDIDQNYINDGINNTGKLSSLVLDYFGLISNNSSFNNKGIYKDLPIEDVCNFLKSKGGSYKKLANSIMMENENSPLEEFKKFYFKNIEKIKEEEAVADVQLKTEFLERFPVERFKTMELNEYSLGLDNPESFSHLVENGKYKNYGISCGNDPNGAGHWGIYYKKDEQCFKNSLNQIVVDSQEYWNDFKNQLYDMLSSLKTETPKFSNEFLYLIKMTKVLPKLCFMYYPNKFLDIVTKENLRKIAEILEFDINDLWPAEQISYELNKYIRYNIPEVNYDEPEYLAAALWKYKEQFDKKEDDIPETEGLKSYSKDLFERRVYLKNGEFDKLDRLLTEKKNIILEGAPGVGKTFMAKRLAYARMGFKDNSRILSLQFHQSYSYEEFVEGLRPQQDGTYMPKDGVFKKFVKNAIENPNKDYYCIIDEINRGNISKIFGELLMLIENDKRTTEYQIKLPYSNEDFYIPSNVYIIGMLNTADRGLTLIDYALRRRFSFYTVYPAFNSKKFINYVDSLGSEHLNKVINKIKELNDVIKEDESLGAKFEIGHSYFCNFEKVSIEKLNNILEFEIKPLIREYWFDQPKLCKEWEQELDTLIIESGE